MAVERKNTNTVETSREGLGFALTSANQNTYPIVYDDDVWAIVKNGKAISDVISGVTGTKMNGTYTQGNITEALSQAIINLSEKVDDAIGTGGSIKAQIDEAINKLDAEKSGSSHGVSVTVKETDGKIESVTVDAPDFVNTYDEKGAANAVLGSEGDDPSKKTVYGVSAAVDQVRGEIDSKIGQLDGNATGSNNGVSVTVRQTDGVINEVTVDNRLLGDVTDTSSANTIYGAKAAAHDVQGNESDTKDDKTVYGAFAAIQEVKDGIDSLKSISEEKIRSLFC